VPPFWEADNDGDGADDDDGRPDRGWPAFFGGNERGAVQFFPPRIFLCASVYGQFCLERRVSVRVHVRVVERLSVFVVTFFDIRQVGRGLQEPRDDRQAPISVKLFAPIFPESKGCLRRRRRRRRRRRCVR